MSSHRDPRPHHQVLSASHIAANRNAAEKRLGIHHHVAVVDFGWSGELRKRYTDFQVNEVRKDGSVIHLSDYEQRDEKLDQKDDSRPQSVALAKVQEPRGEATLNHTLNEQAIAETGSVLELSEEDVAILVGLVGEESTKSLINLDRKIQSSHPDTKGMSVEISGMDDRGFRTKVHHEIRRMFNSRMETQSKEGGVINARAVSSQTQGHDKGQRRPQGRGERRGRPGGDQASGHGRGERRGQGRGVPQAQDNSHAERHFNRRQNLHFTLFKENKDTMEAINCLARLMRVKAATFGFAGTKDRRAATVQRVSVFGKDARELKALNGKLPGIWVGDFEYNPKPIQLGQHGGNQFVIVLKNAQLNRGKTYSIEHRLRAMKQAVQLSLDSISANGFINYFGLQRFGTHAIGTQEIGMWILKGDFKAAVDGILHVEENLSMAIADGNLTENRFFKEDADRARAIAIWRMSGKSDSAVQLLPKKFGAESTLIRHLARSPNDHCGALVSITRGLRSLYIHAYQSLVWNYAATERWARYGSKVVAGDLVLVHSEESPITNRGPAEKMSDEVNQDEELFYQRARPLTEEEAASGCFTIFDIVLPAPGFDVIYPLNDLGKFYVEFMGREENGGLDPFNMRRRQREFSMSGHYRKVLAKFTSTPMFAVRPYSDDEEQMHPTDRDMIEWRKKQESGRREQVSSAWKNFADNVQSFDAAANAETRRRRRESQSFETRINDAWVETGLDHGKRMKVNSAVKQEHVQAHEAQQAHFEVDAVTGNSPKPDAPAEDIEMGDAMLPPEGTVTGAPSLGNKPSPANSSNHDLLCFLENHLKAAEAPASTPASESDAMGDNTPASVVKTPPKVSKQAHSEPPKSPPGSIFENTEQFVDPKHLAVDVSQRFSHLLSREDESDPLTEDKKIAVIVKFALASSSYATICVREMTGQAPA